MGTELKLSGPWSDRYNMSNYRTKYRFYRRCHVCGFMSKDNLEILRCQHCEKNFAKYFFCEDFQQFLKTDDINKIKHGARKSRPLIGISFVWKSKVS